MEEDFMPSSITSDFTRGASGEILYSHPITLDTSSIMEYMGYDERARVISTTGILPMNTSHRKIVSDLIDFVEEMGEFNKINQEDKQELINKINQIL